MDSRKFIKDYREFLKSNSNPERARQEKRYLYSDLKHYGVSVWERRKYGKKVNQDIKRLSKKDALSLVKKFWAMPYFEERAMALGILDVHKDSLNISDMPLIEKMMREARGWAFLDSLIIPFMPIVIRKNKKAYNYLRKWIADKDFWVRRSALLAQLLFFRKDDNGDRELFFEMAKSQFDEGWIDKEYKDAESRKRARFFIRKAIGWTLREMSVKQPKIVAEFAEKYKDQMSGLTYREATRKLA